MADVVLLEEVKADLRADLFAKINDLTSSVARVTKKREKDEHAAKLHSLLAGLSPTHHLAHAPSLDCAGMCVPGSIVYLSPAASTASKTSYTIHLCEEQRLNEENVLIGYHPSLAEKALKALIEDTSSDFLSISFGVKPEEASLSSQRTFGDSRFDFVLETTSRLILIECKNVVGGDYTSGTVPASRSPVGVYCVSSSDRSALFPHGTVTKSSLPVISDRAIKHLDGLTNLHDTKTSDGSKTIESAVVFLINRGDCSAFRPCHEADMLFAQMLLKAQHAGVRVIAQELVWKEDENGEFKGSAGKDLPVTFDPIVDDKDIDPELVAKVLTYNAEHANDRKSPSSSKKQKTK